MDDEAMNQDLWHVDRRFTTWTTKEGERIALADMEDQHLTNAYKLVKRRLDQKVWRLGHMLTLLGRELRYRGLPLP